MSLLDDLFLLVDVPVGTGLILSVDVPVGTSLFLPIGVPVTCTQTTNSIHEW